MLSKANKTEIDFFDKKFFKFTRVSKHATRIFDSHLKYVLQHIKKDEIILDIGCNDGRHTLFLRKQGYKVFGIDISKNALKRSSDIFFSFGELIDTDHKKREKIFLCADAKQLPIKCENVDTVLLLETLHHFRDKDLILKNVKQILKPGGKIIISEPNSKNLLRKFGNYIGKIFNFLSPNEWTLSPNELLKTIEKYFKVNKFILYLHPISISTVFLYEILLMLNSKNIKTLERILFLCDKLLESDKTQINKNETIMWRTFAVGYKI